MLDLDAIKKRADIFRSGCTFTSESAEAAAIHDARAHYFQDTHALIAEVERLREAIRHWASTNVRGADSGILEAILDAKGGPGVCVWRENGDGAWITGCDDAFEFFEDGPTENGARYCQYCGKRIEVVKQEVTDADRD